MDLDADIRSIRHTRSGEMFLGLKHDKTHKGVTYNCLAEQVHGKSVDMRALTTEAILNAKILDEIMNADDFVSLVPIAFRLWNGSRGTWMHMVQLHVVEANKSAGHTRASGGMLVLS